MVVINMYTLVIALFIPAIFVVAFYLLFRRWISGKVKVTMVSDDRKVRTFYLKPKEGMLAFRQNGSAKRYLYDPSMVVIGTQPFITDPMPHLFYHLDTPQPIDLLGRKPQSGITSTELGEAWDDHSIQEFVRAQRTEGAISNKNLANYMLMSSIGLAILSIGGFGMMYYKLSQVVVLLSPTAAAVK